MIRLACLLVVLFSFPDAVRGQSGSTPPRVSFEVECTTVMRRDPGVAEGIYWMQNRAALVPTRSAGETPTAIMVLYQLLGRSDFFSGVYTMRSEDLGATWTAPERPVDLDWVRDGEVNIAVADVTPMWHAPSGKLIAIGAQVRYSPEGKQLEDRPLAHQTAYSVFDPGKQSWTKWRTIEMPAEKQFNFARNACAQSLVEEDGTLLLPFYIGEGTHKPFSSTVVRASFDDATNTLRYLEHGNVLALNVKRGLYEPSLTRFGGRYFLTLRNDVKGYVSVSDDGLQFDEPKPWTFDDGKELGSYNTQQHWVNIGGGLFLVYTRRGADNDHVIRHRAPLFMAQVDPEKLVVMRDTEQVLVPERGATLGNSGVTFVDADEAWVTVSEANSDRPEAKKRGADNSVYLVKVRAAVKD